ncbi:MAG: sulfotransferase [Pseudomonadota bacterium]
MTPSPILVLGMHRSGTSCLAGCLEAGGLYLGDVDTYSNFNKKGTRENRDLMEVHDAALAAHGAAWDAPPPGPVSWPADQFAPLKAHVESFGDRPLWGGKDPRALFLLEGWERLTEPRYVATYRHPAAVIASLTTRAKAWGDETFTETKALGLWTAYNARLLDQRARAPFPLIRFDQSAEDYLAKLADLCAPLGLDGAKAAEFYSGQLRNHDDAAAPVPEAAREIWERLEEAAV